MVAAAEPVRPAPQMTSIAFARDIAAWFSGQIDSLEHALANGEQAFADRLAALLLGAERTERVRAAMALELNSITVTWGAIEQRWERARKFCAFPTDEAVSAAMNEMSGPPTEPTKENQS